MKFFITTFLYSTFFLFFILVHGTLILINNNTVHLLYPEHFGNKKFKFRLICSDYKKNFFIFITKHHLFFNH